MWHIDTIIVGDLLAIFTTDMLDQLQGSFIKKIFQMARGVLLHFKMVHFTE